MNQVGRYDLESKTFVSQLEVDDSLYRGSASLFNTEYNYYDLSVDENGLWLIYAFKPEASKPAWPDSLLIAKLEPNYLDIEKTWNITVTRGKFCNSFIAQGILYLLESCTTKQTSFSFAYDLYSDEVVNISLPFINAFRNNKMLSYEYSRPNRQNILAYDGRNIISYPIRDK